MAQPKAEITVRRQTWIVEAKAPGISIVAEGDKEGEQLVGMVQASFEAEIEAAPGPGRVTLRVSPETLARLGRLLDQARMVVWDRAPCCVLHGFFEEEAPTHYECPRCFVAEEVEEVSAPAEVQAPAPRDGKVGSEEAADVPL